jgi:transposase
MSSQPDRAFRGLTVALPDVLGTKIGRPVAAEVARPARRLSALGVNKPPRAEPQPQASGRTAAGHRAAGRHDPLRSLSLNQRTLAAPADLAGLAGMPRG